MHRLDSLNLQPFQAPRLTPSVSLAMVRDACSGRLGMSPDICQSLTDACCGVHLATNLVIEALTDHRATAQQLLQHAPIQPSVTSSSDVRPLPNPRLYFECLQPTLQDAYNKLDTHLHHDTSLTHYGFTFLSAAACLGVSVPEADGIICVLYRYGLLRVTYDDPSNQDTYLHYTTVPLPSSSARSA